MSATKEKVLNEISQLIGKREGSPEINKLIDDYNKITPRPAGYLMKYTDPWCAAGLSAVFFRCDALDIFPAECHCARMIAKASTMGILRYRNELRFITGDIIFYDWDKNGVADHVGILSEKQDGKLKIIECNKNDAVGIRIIDENDTRARASLRASMEFLQISKAVHSQLIWKRRISIPSSKANLQRESVTTENVFILQEAVTIR